MKPIQVYLEPAEIKQLKQEALDEDISLSDLIRSYLEIKPKVHIPNVVEGPVDILNETQRGVTLPKIIKTIEDVPELPTHSVRYCKNGHSMPDGRDRCLFKKCKYA